ncbi:MAG: glutamate formimidoyltransferase [Tenericutes bacterium GWC2_34_14]|nr:MAG: glutamate formimidoyltransferase [Tenericutes bacterium GWA2_35_7]OHE30050.1 MAG: glutamate formimidoyltransferase [Tenericutes bacterium GWC2_34_14]OHE35029.1 MAG: glutamate formimidoyltransferase [Tenericutes bacterium GWE2_34_108]OHE37111.1 MAG: glutamate formimidoyltransferase [Tenericutes bacterium GWF1_35_14]OHE39757.1 MAG: glutamate formimidoyltransferase [Tenericutes bacterium GWF2_35_184]OHE43989.1 MAG: glutamate formimidoyltransferase [Tenericutes bacterium RIFOXYA12_FULL_35_
MMKIVQCVPNISEGRDLQKIERIIEPLRHQEGFKLISYEPDKDYNRTVITLIGDPDKMIIPLINFVQKAMEEIDMNQHHGEHPRMGAVDVIPFIPIQEMTLDECVNYAKSLADHVSFMYQIPVFLYAKAAQVKERESLPEIRRGEFEGMKEKIQDPMWKPDYGPSFIHPTFGVVAIGARLPLIAFNIDLNTMDEKIASAIAKAIRQSSGGFQYIQAGPATLVERGHVQVTMNILDYKKNPIYRILETVKMEAKRYQVNVMSSEIVGLLPKEAITDSLKYYLQTEKITFDKNMSFETIVELVRTYLLFRDFDIEKMIEANL